MYILHSYMHRCAQIDSEQFLLDPCYALCNFWLNERGRER